MTNQKSIDAIKAVKRANDKSGGNVVDLLPIKVEPKDFDYSIIQTLATTRPRLLMNQSTLSEFKKSLAVDPSHCSFDEFYEKSTEKFVGVTPYDEPSPYPIETVTKPALWRPYWRKMYTDCQMALNATRNLSIYGIVKDDYEAIESAKAWTLKLAGYDTNGVTCRAHNDEAAFRLIVAIAWGYDWLYDHFNQDERVIVKNALIARLDEIMFHVEQEIDLLTNPLDSHGVRSISSAVIPTCIALLHDYPKAKDYLKYAFEFYSIHYPPWGGEDGGWAEGPDYWNTQNAFLGEAFDLIKAYADINMFDKTFYQNTGDFPLYCMPVHSRRASFGDLSSLGDLPGLKLAYNIKHYAGVTGNPEYVWYYDELEARDKDANSKFYNYGWWDFGYDKLRFNILWECPEAKAPSDEPLLKVFPDTGWAAFHSNMSNKDEHIHLIFKSSPFGSISHSHADQNTFTLHAFGETLASVTGYYIGYGVDMHSKWRRQSLSKNLPLFNGKGQYGESKATGYKDHHDKYCLESCGKISSYETEKDVKFIEGDATEAYKYYTPEIESYVRKIWFVQGKVFVIRDQAKFTKEVDMTWLMHTTFDTSVSSESFCISAETAQLDVSVINDSRHKIDSIQNVVGFGEVDASEFEGQDVHSHVEISFSPSLHHDVLTLLVPSKIGFDKPTITHEVEGGNLLLSINGEESVIQL
ncbi:DUF4962 domain-containing protein [Vibrio astriarenae]|uniref:DUF4962 domain-containing protein n=1 Tax=Vibrio astriarenae TaxID=1481923 RepID=A0A7Z2T6W2_9VIBR|nr:heparinase II/III family protein [Vibrio astriarenae]QIA65489.1 DUF4962 domain-containing protein [Vibrio astriarenae]